MESEKWNRFFIKEIFLKEFWTKDHQHLTYGGDY